MRLLMLFIGGLLITPTDSKAEELGCRTSSDEFNCVFQHRHELNQNGDDAQRQYFWSVLSKEQSQAIKCQEPQVTHILQTATMDDIGAEVGEWVAEAVEGICVKQTICFMISFSKLTREEQRLVIDELRHPTFYSEEETAKCIKK